MQQAHDIFTLSFIASGAVAAYRGVDFSGAQITAAGARPAGIAKRGAASGAGFEAAVIGTAVCEAGGSFSVGDPLQMDSSGRVIAATALVVAAGATSVTSTAANGAIITGGIVPQAVIGHALEASTGVGEFHEVLLRH
jgi:hypothetical protein